MTMESLLSDFPNLKKLRSNEFNFDKFHFKLETDENYSILLRLVASYPHDQILSEIPFLKKLVKPCHL